MQIFHSIKFLRCSNTLIKNYRKTNYPNIFYLLNNSFKFTSQKNAEQNDLQMNEQINRKQLNQSSQNTKKRHFQLYPVQKYEVGQRLDRYLKNTKLNWTLAQKFLRNKQIFIMNSKGQKVKQNDYRLQEGDIMHVKHNVVPFLHTQKPITTNLVSYEYAKQKLDEMVIFDNKNLTILNKPADFSVQGGQEIDRNLFSLMAARYKKQFVHVIHRLDKPTSGVLFFCKNLKTAQLVQSAIENRKQYNKYYLAVTVGQKIKHKEEYIRCNIEWTKKQKARITQSMQKQDSKDSITYYKRLHTKQLSPTGQSLNLMGLKLITGRKHQIRCHLKDFLSNPILNDRRYGAVMLKKDEKNLEITDNSDSKDEGGFIFLHALMTTIKSDQIATSLFQVSEERLQKSRRNQSIQIIESNQNGVILLKKGQIKIIGSLPKYWHKFNFQSHQSTSYPNLKDFCLEYQLNEIKIGQQIQSSEKNLWIRHKPHRKVMTIE